MQPLSECHVEETPRLIPAIRAVRDRVGDGLNDDELTRLLRESALPSEAGFHFLSFCQGVVTFSVPRQDLAQWYPEQGWIAPAKEKVARTLAEKHGLSLCEPPDQSSTLATTNVRHHLELTNRWASVVVAHPDYLKVRMYGARPHSPTVADARTPLALDADLLNDLAALYRP